MTNMMFQIGMWVWFAIICLDAAGLVVIVWFGLILPYLR